MANVKLRAKVQLRSREFTREYFKRDGEGTRRSYDWNGVPVSYRSGHERCRPDLQHRAQARRKKSEYALPPEAHLGPEDARCWPPTRALPRIQPHPFALGAEDGELELFESDQPSNLGGYSAHGLGVNPARSKKVPVRHAGRAPLPRRASSAPT